MYSCLLFIHPCLLMKIYPMSLYSYLFRHLTDRAIAAPTYGNKQN